MMKRVFAAIFAVTACVPEAAAQSLLQRSDRQDRTFETYLPRANPTIPWLELDTKTKLPKGDIPLGRDVASFGPFVLPPSGGGDIQVSTTAESPSRSM